jgi:hypothetical protein
MATKRLPRPRDPIALAKLIGDIATGQVVDAVEDGKDTKAVERGRAGGRSRAGVLTTEQRVAIARKAAKTRRSGHVNSPLWGHRFVHTSVSSSRQGFATDLGCRPRAGADREGLVRGRGVG